MIACNKPGKQAVVFMGVKCINICLCFHYFLLEFGMVLCGIFLFYYMAGSWCQLWWLSIIFIISVMVKFLTEQLVPPVDRICLTFRGTQVYPLFCEIRVAQSLVFCVVFYFLVSLVSLFLCCPIYCLSFYLHLLITPVLFSNKSHYTEMRLKLIIVLASSPMCL